MLRLNTFMHYVYNFDITTEQMKSQQLSKTLRARCTFWFCYFHFITLLNYELNVTQRST